MPVAPLVMPVAGFMNGKKTLLVAGPIHMGPHDVLHTVANMVLMTVARRDKLMLAIELRALVVRIAQADDAACQPGWRTEMIVYGP